jgi:RadC-like JAB domain
MAKQRTATVAYEDARTDKKEAAYLGHVRRALDSMGAPNSGELVHNSGAYLTGVYRAGIEPKEAAAVIWHRHCDAGGSRATPCVAEASECGSCSGANEEELRLTMGYGYEYRGRNWGSSKDDDWEIVILPESAFSRGKFVGTRSVDGTRVGVFQAGPGTFYAQTIQSLARGVAAAECPPGTPGASPAPRAVALLALAEAKSGIKAMRGPTGLAVWRLPGSDLEIMWSGPGSRLLIGQATKPGGHVSSIDHHTANGNYDTFKQADAAVAAFLAAGDPGRLEFNDSAPSGVPFTKLERQEGAGPDEEVYLPNDRAVYDYIAPYLHKQTQEVVLVLGIDLHRNLKSNTEIGRGQVDQVIVSDEDVTAPIVASRPHGFILIHNHPSGHAEPSPKDIKLTARIKAAAAVACPNTVWLDHLVIGRGEYYSFTDGKLKKI